MKLNLYQTAEIVKGWIQSCETSEQIQLCKDAIKVFVQDRYSGHDLLHVQTDLCTAIEKRETYITTTKIFKQEYQHY